MAYVVGLFDPDERQREKQRSRQRDLARLLSGQIDRDGLKRENGFFSGLNVAEARIVNRRARYAQQMAPAGV